MIIDLPEYGDEPASGSHSPPIYSIVYCSRASAGVDDAVVDRIIETARRHNAEHGITGLLVFGSGIFFQWLEGPRESVLALMALIQKDPRHQAIVMLNPGEELGDRVFGDWDMELVGGEDVRTVLLDALDEAQDPANAKALRGMLAQLESDELRGLGRH
jgi:hypothetical protein